MILLRRSRHGYCWDLPGLVPFSVYPSRHLTYVLAPPLQISTANDTPFSISICAGECECVLTAPRDDAACVIFLDVVLTTSQYWPK